MLHQPLLVPCDVLCGQRNHKLQRMRNTYERGASGFEPLAPRLPDHAGYTFYGWRAPPVPGGGCGGLDFPQGFADHFGFRLQLRRTRALCADVPLCFYYRCGLLAQRGIMEGMRLVAPLLWQPMPDACIELLCSISRDERFVVVKGKWVGCATPPTTPA